jgi:superfamily II DNA or RNA helicase
MRGDEDLQAQLQNALAECSRLREENARLQRLIPDPVSRSNQSPESTEGKRLDRNTATTSDLVRNSSPPETKVALFRSLFFGREDVYAVRWEGKNGRSGYSPAGIREWSPTRLENSNLRPVKYKFKMQSCFPLTDDVIRDHLIGKHTVGIYPLLLDDTCHLLAADFDKKSWKEDALAYLQTCFQFEVPAALERSRSGKGGHVWIFFNRPIPAALARKLGCFLLTRTMERRHQVGLDSYDRFFPNQDTLPKGGFGNLIALPLQRIPRNLGNSVFLDQDFQPYPDQWIFLSATERMHVETVQRLVREASHRGDILGVRMSLSDENASEVPWTLPPSGKQVETRISDPLPESVRITRGNLLYIEKRGLPSAMLNRLIRLAAFQNPEFYKAQAMRLSTFGKPRIISCAEDFPQHVGLPRGCIEEALSLLRNHGIIPDIADERFPGLPIQAQFRGELRSLQHEAAESLLKYDDGIFCAPTAFGKTVVAAWLIAARRVNTLVLVHRRHLLDQWRERLRAFLDMSDDDIGQIGGGKDSRSGIVDVGIVQSLITKGVVKDFVGEYGQVFVDECHHVSAFTFERVLKQIRARYVVGLTATPVRKDGHHPIIVMQCGPLRFRLNAKKLEEADILRHVVIPRFTSFEMPFSITEPAIQDIYAALARDPQRNGMIIGDLLQALKRGRAPLLLTERTKHLEQFEANLKGVVPNLFVLRGGMGKRQRAAFLEKLKAVPEDEQRVILATGRYIGEGFDDARLDTLLLAMPISWRGTLQQYVGRLHRLHNNKQVVEVYDYVDTRLPMLQRMFEKRSRGYKTIGYSIEAGTLDSYPDLNAPLDHTDL